MKGSVEKVTSSPEALKGVSSNTFQSAVYSAASTTGLTELQKSTLRVYFCAAGSESSTIIAIQTTPKTGIKTVKDLKGKIVYAENPSLVFFGPIMEAILKANGMTKADIKWQIFNNSSDAYRDLKEGRVDALFYVTGADSTSLAQDAGLFAVPLDPATQKAVEDLGLGYSAYIWPKGQFGNTIDTQTLASPNLVWANNQTPDDAGYAFVKAVFTHLDEVQKSSPAAAGFTRENAFAQWTYPYHPGAIKYFKEAGWWTADMDKKQADLIAKWSAVK
jgi:TRAP transporter TAXI family solute receptor